jgi:hypothetical protein
MRSNTTATLPKSTLPLGSNRESTSQQQTIATLGGRYSDHNNGIHQEMNLG